MILDLSLKNKKLYAGCELIRVGRQRRLVTPPAVAAGHIRHNVLKLINVESEDERADIVLTGRAEAWGYLIVFSVVAGKFERVLYDDNLGNVVLVSRRREV